MKRLIGLFMLVGLGVVVFTSYGGEGVGGVHLSSTKPVNLTQTAELLGESGSGDGAGAAARFNSPYGIATDGPNLYVADSNNSTIRKIVIATGAVSTIAGTAGRVGTTDGTGAMARFNHPFGITTDGKNIYVADSFNHAIRKIIIATGAVSTIAGMAGSVGTMDGTGTAARFYYPYGITTDGTSLYVADSGNHTIRRIVIATGVVSTIAGTAGSIGMADGTGVATQLSSPSGITNDGINSLLPISVVMRSGK
jgi:hypothetical protein